MARTLGQLGFFSRIGAAMRLLTRGSLEDVVHHFNRARAGKMERPTNAYRKVAIIRAAVDRKAGGLASMPMMLSTVDDRIIDRGPVFDLIQRPNPRMGMRDFVSASCAWLDLTGAVHWVFTRMSGGRPMEIVPVGAPQMRPRFERPGGGDLIGWRYRPAGRRWDEAINLGLDELWTVGLDTFDPNEPFGFSAPLESADLPISQIYKADIANEASLENGVEPGGVLTHKDGEPTGEQLNNLREEMRERHAGPKNRRRPLVLYGSWEWTSVSASFKDMEFSTLKKISVSDACAAIGVDPAAVGWVPDGVRQEYIQAAKDGLWHDAILPRAHWLADEFRRGVLARYDGERSMQFRRSFREASRRLSVSQRSIARDHVAAANMKVWFDDSRVPAVAEHQLSKAQQAGVLVDKLKATPADVIEMLNLRLEIHPWQRQAWQSTTEMPVGEPLPGEDDPHGSEPAPGEEEGGGQGQQEETAQRIERAEEDDRLRRLWLQWRASWRGLEKQMNSKLGGHFRRLQSETLTNLERVLAGRSIDADAERVTVPLHWEDAETGQVREACFDLTPVQRDVIGEILFDIVAANEKLLGSTGPIIREAVRLGGQQVMDEVAAQQNEEEPEAFNIRSEEAQASLRRRRQRIVNVNRRESERLRATLAEGMQAGENMDELSERVRQRFRLAGSRARTIARTEIGGAVEESRAIGRDQAGVPLKGWLWSHKETGRPSHRATEGKYTESPIPNDELFTIAGTGVTCPHPRATGRPEHDINCGCTTISRFPGDSIKTAAEKILARGVLTHEQLAARDRAAGQTTHSPATHGTEADHAADDD